MLVNMIEQKRKYPFAIGLSPRVDHINAVFESDPNNIVLREVRGNRGQAGTDTVRLIGLGDGQLARSIQKEEAKSRTF
jgi:hypothetical protein